MLPGAFRSLRGTSRELARNVTSLGFDVEALVTDKKLVVDHVRVERSEIEEAGEYDLEGLFVRLGHAIDSVKAKRVALDTIEALFGGFDNQTLLRAELRRLFGWLKTKGVTAVITGERGAETLTRQGIEEYVSDCVIALDHRVNDQLSTRRLRIVKYRGSLHGTNEYPFLIDDRSISVLPVTSIGLNYDASNERISSGVPELDRMLDGKGFYRGSTLLASGAAGTGKTSLAAHFAEAACRRGERCLYVALEESPGQILRNMQSIGIDLSPYVNKKLLRFHAVRPSAYGLEMHLVTVFKLVEELRPKAVVLDPLTALLSMGDKTQVVLILMRLIDFLKTHRITAFFTSLTNGDSEDRESGVSSLIDTWLTVRNVEANGERNRALFILKSRGMPHSNQAREFVLTDKGVQLIEVYRGTGGEVFTGSRRATRQDDDRAAARIKGKRAS